MPYFTGPKKRSRLQGHRKRRRIFEIPVSRRQGGEGRTEKVDWIEYKTIRQYQSMGDVLNECKTYGFGAGIESMIHTERTSSLENGHSWLTEDQGDSP